MGMVVWLIMPSGTNPIDCATQDCNVDLFHHNLRATKSVVGLTFNLEVSLQLTVFFGNNSSLLRITHLWIVAAKTCLMFMQNYITSDIEHHNCHNLYNNFSMYSSNLQFSQIKNDICMFRLHTIYWHHLALSGLPHFTNVISCHLFTSDWCCTISALRDNIVIARAWRIR